MVTVLKILLDENETHYWQISRLFDEIDRCDSSVDHSRISPLVSRYLSRFGIANDILTVLDSLRPKFQRAYEEINAIERKWSPLMGLIAQNSKEEMLLNPYAFPTSKFMYPKGPKDKQWAQRCEDVDRAFLTFWDKADQEIKGLYGHPVFELARKIASRHTLSQTNWCALGMYSIN